MRIPNKQPHQAQMHHINFGLTLACMALLVYSPFVQRSLVLMGAAGARGEVSIAAR